jgi:hypothetical protein
MDGGRGTPRLAQAVALKRGRVIGFDEVLEEIARTWLRDHPD